MAWVWVLVVGSAAATGLLGWLAVRLWRKAVALARELGRFADHGATLFDLVGRLGSPPVPGAEDVRRAT